MLKSSVLLLTLGNLYFSDIKYLLTVFFVLLIFNFYQNSDFKNRIKNIKSFLFFYFIASLFQIFFTQSGNVLFKIFNIYITSQGVMSFLVSFIRITNLFLLSWLIKFELIFNKRAGNYGKIISIIIFLVPEVLQLFRKRMKIKWFFRHILKQTKKRI